MNIPSKSETIVIKITVIAVVYLTMSVSRMPYWVIISNLLSDFIASVYVCMLIPTCWLQYLMVPVNTYSTHLLGGSSTSINAGGKYFFIFIMLTIYNTILQSIHQHGLVTWLGKSVWHFVSLARLVRGFREYCLITGYDLSIFMGLKRSKERQMNEVGEVFGKVLRKILKPNQDGETFD